MKHWFRIIRGDSSSLPQQRFVILSRLGLIFLAVSMAALWYLSAPAVLNSEERLLWEKVRAAQAHIFEWNRQNGASVSESTDPWGCGLIGVEWSGLTTTLGDLSSKQAACNPAWAVQFKRWFQGQGLKPGDHIAIYSSSSFPGLLLSAIAAAELMELKPLLIVSLGASTWGANDPDRPWPVLAAELRRSGFIRHRADFYTLGGGDETGQGLSPEGEALLHTAAENAGVRLLTASNLEEMITLKTDLLEMHRPRLFVSIGGSHANLGDDPEVLRMQTGPVPQSDIEHSGNGVIGVAMHKNIPVIHMLNIRSLSNMAGIAYDSSPRRVAPATVSKWWSLAGLVLFFAVLVRHKRWRLELTSE